MDPARFIAQMKQWNADLCFRPDAALMGVPNAALRAVTVPTLLFAGNDEIHTKEVSNAMAELMPNVTLLPCAWSVDQWNAKINGRTPAAVYDLQPAMTPAILTFIATVEMGQSTT